MLSGVNEMFGSRLKAAFIAQEHQIPWGNKNFTNFTMANVTSPTMGRVELQLYDHIHNMSLLTVAVSFFLFMMGCAALKATAKQKSKVAQRCFRRNFFFFCFFLVFYVFTRKQSRSFMTVYQSLTDGDKNETAIAANMSTDVTEEAKRNLKAIAFRIHDGSLDLGQVYKRQHVPQEVQDVMNNMKWSQQKEMDDVNDHDLNDVFERHQLPEEVKDMMKAMKYHGKKMYKKAMNKKHSYWYPEEDDVEDYDDEPKEGEWDGRKEAFRMFAPGLWEKANRRHGRHGPMVRATKDKKDTTKSWPKMHSMCPVMLFFIFASIYQICHIKFLEKAEAKLELLLKAKKLIKRGKPKPVLIPSFPVAPVEDVPVIQPVPQKKCKKQNKMGKFAQQMVQQVVMPQMMIAKPQAAQVMMPVIQ
jgi:hypothetical protein